MKKKNLLFVNDEMMMGGVARVLNNLLEQIDKDKYNVDLLIIHKRGELLSEIPTGVRIIEGTSFFDTVDIPLSQSKGITLIKKLILLFYMKTGLIKRKIVDERKRILNKTYDVEFSAKEGFCTIFTAYGDSKKKLNWVLVDYKKSNYSKHHMTLVKDALKNIDMNIANSDVVLESYKEVFGVNRIMKIPNIIDEKRTKEFSLKTTTNKFEKDRINLICVARFHRQKGIDRLIKAYGKLENYYSLMIVGDGELKEELHQIAKEYNVDDKIRWMGVMTNPYPEIRESDLLVMPSLYEGYAVLSVESLISGTPVLVTDVAGARELIVKDEYGWVVPNDDNSIYQKLFELKDKKDLLSKYKGELADYHYDSSQIMNKYYELFDAEN